MTGLLIAGSVVLGFLLGAFIVVRLIGCSLGKALKGWTHFWLWRR